MDEEVQKVKRDFKSFDKTGEPSETSYRERVNREKQITSSKTLTDQCMENQRSMEKELVTLCQIII